MIDLAIISGSGFYDFPGLTDDKDHTVKTKYGPATVTTGSFKGKNLAFVARHGKDHSLLPNMINYRANLMGLKTLGAQAILGTTICGVLDPEIPLTKIAVFEDMYFPDNRLPSGEACTIYEEAGRKGRGHFLFDRPFCQKLREQVIKAVDDPIAQAVYAHVNGPRFNSKAEIKFLQMHATYISQTAGPEAVLAGELEIPYVLLGYGVDYANGVKAEPTPVSVLSENLKKSKDAFLDVIRKLLVTYSVPKFEGYIYRFD